MLPIHAVYSSENFRKDLILLDSAIGGKRLEDLSLNNNIESEFTLFDVYTRCFTFYFRKKLQRFFHSNELDFHFAPNNLDNFSHRTREEIFSTQISTIKLNLFSYKIFNAVWDIFCKFPYSYLMTRHNLSIMIQLGDNINYLDFLLKELFLEREEKISLSEDSLETLIFNYNYCLRQFLESVTCREIFYENYLRFPRFFHLKYQLELNILKSDSEHLEIFSRLVVFQKRFRYLVKLMKKKGYPV